MKFCEVRDAPCGIFFMDMSDGAVSIETDTLSLRRKSDHCGRFAYTPALHASFWGA